MKKIVVLILLLFVFTFVLPPFPVLAITCDDNLQDLLKDKNDDEKKSILNEYAVACEAKISQLQTEKASLKSALSLITSKINLTQAQIRNTNAQISQLEEDINSLGVVIADLNVQLDQLAKIYVSRIRESYKGHKPSVVTLFFQSKSFTTFQNKLKYLRIAQKRDEIILNELESARLSYDEQKTTKEQKQAEIEELKNILESQKKVLGVQSSQKNQLLTQTQNDERKYQQMLQEAQRQLAAFRRFISDQGGASILTNQTFQDSWGSYYNQRDSQWGNQLIGLSSETMKEVGCLITSMAMIASHYNKSLTPGQIASSPDPFWNSTAYMQLGQWTVNGVTMNRTRIGYSVATLDNELANGKPVIVGIYGGPDHFLVIKEKKDGNYIMNDPFIENGRDLKFTDRYPLSAISTVDRVTVN